MCDLWMPPQGELILTDAAGTPEIFADGAVILRDGTTARMVLFSGRSLGDGRRKHQVVGRVTMTRRGWEWSTASLKSPAEIIPVAPRLN